MIFEIFVNFHCLTPFYLLKIQTSLFNPSQYSYILLAFSFCI
nr:MAG TPA: hypothetical protein [Caudoviricetes sp.]